MDEFIKKYGARLQKMYDDRTAGDHSFTGILSEFLEEIVDSEIAMAILNDRRWRLGVEKVKRNANCSKVLREKGEPYPRTCLVHGLGPCE